jgi:hypothetical protein
MVIDYAAVPRRLFYSDVQIEVLAVIGQEDEC